MPRGPGRARAADGRPAARRGVGPAGVGDAAGGLCRGSGRRSRRQPPARTLPSQPGALPRGAGALRPRLFGARASASSRTPSSSSTTDDEVFFVDQHVAHERVLFERLPARSGRGPAGLAGAALPASRSSCGAGQAALLERLAPSRSSGWASRSRASAAPPSCCARCPRCSRARSPGGSSRRWWRSWPARQGRAAPPLDRALAFVACRAADQGPRAARSARRWRGCVARSRRHRDAVLLPARPAHRQPAVAAATSSGSSSARGEARPGRRPSAASLLVVGPDRRRQDRGGGARSRGRLRDRGGQRRLAPGLPRHGHRHRQADRRGARGGAASSDRRRRSRRALPRRALPRATRSAAIAAIRGARAPARRGRRHRALRPRAAARACDPAPPADPALRASWRRSPPRDGPRRRCTRGWPRVDPAAARAAASQRSGPRRPRARGATRGRRRCREPQARLAAADGALATCVMIGLRRARAALGAAPRGRARARWWPVA